jgi:hypothetical protein
MHDRILLAQKAYALEDQNNAEQAADHVLVICLHMATTISPIFILV